MRTKWYLCLGLLQIMALSRAPAFAQPLGETYIAGAYGFEDLQHIGSCGRQIAVDDTGFVYLVWTYLDGADGRHAYYNRWEPETTGFTYGIYGEPVGPSGYSAFVSIAMDMQTHPFVAFHGAPGFSPTRLWPFVVSGSCDFALQDTVAGSYVQPLWLQIAIGHSGYIHLLMQPAGIESNFMPLYYVRGLPVYEDHGHPCEIQWQTPGGNPDLLFLDSSTVVGHTDAASRVSSRVALGWMHPRDYTSTNNDVMLQVSDNGGESWNPCLNITDFVDGDPNCLRQTHDTLRCNRDTLRAAADLSLLFDNHDHLHAAFTSTSYYHWRNGAEGPFILPGASLIWRWNEATGQFSLVANGWIAGSGCGLRQTIVERPGLSLDSATGFLYYAYLRYDSTQVSERGYYNADVWISVSTDEGVSWSTGTNVTRTRPSVIPAPAGESLSERDPTLSEVATDDHLHLSYVIDHDAGTVIYGEGTYSLNHFIYQRIPVDSIATTPLMPRYPLHWDSAGFLSAQKAPFIPHPSSLTLSAFPNPFNSRTVITFELPVRARAEVKVFDLLGRRVATLYADVATAGEHAISWNAEANASGLYFIRLQSQGITKTQKIVLLK